MKRSLPLLAALAVIVALGGCGSSGDSTSQPAGTIPAEQAGSLTKAQFIAKADAICRASKPTSLALEAKYRTLEAAQTRNYQAAGDIFDRLADLAEANAEQLHKLVPPPGDAATVNAYLSTGESALPVARELADAIRANDGPAARRLSLQLKALAGKTQRIASGYGFRVCGRG